MSIFLIAVNASQASPAQPSWHDGNLKGSVHLGINLKQGLNAQEDWRAGTRLEYEKQDYSINFESRLAQQSINDISTKNEYRFRVDVAKDINEQLALEALVRTEQDKFRLIEESSALGSGFRYKWINSERLQVFSGLSAIWESRYIDITDERQASWRFDIKTNLEWKITESATLIGLLDYESEFADTSDFNATFNLALRSNLSSRVGLTLQYEVEHDDVETLNFKEKQSEISTLIDYRF